MNTPLAASVAVFLLVGSLRAADLPRPNVLLVCVDDLKPLLGSYGAPTIRTPNVDRLAARGVRFERAFCNQAVCAPSRNALMTGLRSTSLGIYDLATNFRVAAPAAVTVAQYFQQQGWRTEALGKIMHRGHGNREDAASWSVPHWAPRGGNYAAESSLAAQAKKGKSHPRGPDAKAKGEPGDPGYQPADVKGPAVESPDVPDDAYPDGKIAAEAIQRLRAAKARPAEPFFLAVGFIKPHLPFSAPKKYWDWYDRNSLPLAPVQAAPEGAPIYAPTAWGELRAYTDIPPSGPLSADQQRELIHGYHAAVSYMDAQLGRVLDELDRLDLARNTIVVFWGDHGWHLGDHGQWCKHSNYEEAVRIPIIVSAPDGNARGVASRALVETVDIFPTLAELAGLPVPKLPQTLDGRSFAATVRDGRAPTKEAVFHVYPRTRPGVGAVLGRAVRTERYRLVEWKQPGADPASAELELYDYVADPLERKNLAASQPEAVAQLRRLLAQQPEARPQVRSTEPAAPKKKKKV
jgi:iduronate 2-sulfatase